MKYLKTFEEIKKDKEKLPIDKTDKFKFKKDPRKFSWNQKKPNKEGIYLGLNNKWQVRVKDVNDGRIKSISQHLYKDEAQKAYDDYYKNNKKIKKTIAKNTDEFKKIYGYKTDTASGINTKTKTRNFYNPNQPNETDWVIININIPSKPDQKFIKYINNTIGRIKTKLSENTFIVEYKKIPENIKNYFIDNTKQFKLNDIKHYSKTKKDLKKFIKIIPNPTVKTELNLNDNTISYTKTKWLNLSRKKLTKLPKIPNDINTLTLSGNDLIDIPKLPNSITKLNISDNPSLIELSELPENLIELTCMHLNISRLPKLPKTLKKLNCNGCKFLTELPELPESLTNLYASDCNLKKLPKLPNNLIELICRDNDLTYLPKLPESLRRFESFRWLAEGNKLPYKDYNEYLKYIRRYKKLIDKYGYDNAMQMLNDKNKYNL